MTIVSNSTPLIALATIGAIDLLPSLLGSITIPEAVWREVVIEGKGKPGEQEVAQADWIEIRAGKNRTAVQQLMQTFRLKDGESEAIVFAQELAAARVILDELAARRCAERKGLAVIGTLGILLLAKAAQLIPSVQERMDALIAAGFFVDSATYQDVLHRAGEP